MIFEFQRIDIMAASDIGGVISNGNQQTNLKAEWNKMRKKLRKLLRMNGLERLYFLNNFRTSFSDISFFHQALQSIAILSV
jgi:hypothetical protein